MLITFSDIADRLLIWWDVSYVLREAIGGSNCPDFSASPERRPQASTHWQNLGFGKKWLTDVRPRVNRRDQHSVHLRECAMIQRGVDPNAYRTTRERAVNPLRCGAGQISE